VSYQQVRMLQEGRPLGTAQSQMAGGCGCLQRPDPPLYGLSLLIRASAALIHSVAALLRCSLG